MNIQSQYYCNIVRISICDNFFQKLEENHLHISFVISSFHNYCFEISDLTLSKITYNNIDNQLFEYPHERIYAFFNLDVWNNAPAQLPKWQLSSRWTHRYYCEKFLRKEIEKNISIIFSQQIIELSLMVATF